jgi:DNA polymerase-2
MTTHAGWLLDVYPDSQAGVALWLVGEDGQRYRLRQTFPVTFYAAGPAPRLRDLWRYLEAQPIRLSLSRTERRDLFSEDPLTVLAVQVQLYTEQPCLFQQVAEAFPDLTYFDADVPLALRHAALHNTFPLAHCKVVVDRDDLVQEIEVLDSPWDLEPPPPPLRTLWLEPDQDPGRRMPQNLLIRSSLYRGLPAATYRLALRPERPMLVNLHAVLDRHDPDLLLTAWGDTWLLPHLISRSDALGIPLLLNRDVSHRAAYRPERSYFSYGQVIYRGQQVHLFGRCHIDCGNAMMWDDYELEGVMETARLTHLPLQTAARTSPGTGISSMQMLTALRLGVLVPWHKQQVESPKTALDMFAADQGGMVYQPTIGLHRDVAEIDFVSMYPGIMVRFNISPETVDGRRPEARSLRRIPSPGSEAEPGLVPQTLAPLLVKRLALKTQLASLPCWDPRRKTFQARASAHKWLLVTCFGYLGYKNARFGRIEAHEAVTAYGREALMRAKEAAEDLGCTILHLYVDGLWVQKPGASTVADFQVVLEAISERTGLPISLDGIYRWVAFLSSRVDERVPVPNRYFGVFQDGTLKVRGIEARRDDAPPFVAETQMQILELLARDETIGLRRALSLLRRKLADLRAGRVPLESLVINQKLSRELEAYRVPSPPARAAAQLLVLGKSFRPGQRVRFIYTRGEPNVYAWDLPEPLNPAAVDLARYARLLLRAASAVLEPFGIAPAGLAHLVGPLPVNQLRLSAPPRSLRGAFPTLASECQAIRWAGIEASSAFSQHH